ncbi:MAG: type II secretion system protein, partial [Terrimicrobiaceae bacterium]
MKQSQLEWSGIPRPSGRALGGQRRRGFTLIELLVVI